ncbi:sulfite exporter TauE/SafE family protein [Flammeovirgaceae bacterium KN852]|uniref:Probable membrane transporter protein n=1 Tax=Marinigracilibium pacificum TaxID=2729599 RepID=A0A848IYJ6_9BACT|nr:sulfite exporter TauE/SafE family protein [Marinigracilibium pacificum]
MTDYLLLFGVGAIAGFINVIAGGGSFFVLPLMMFIGIPPAVANATNRVAVLLQSISGVAGFRSKGVKVSKFGWYIAASAVVGSIIGTQLAIEINQDLFKKSISVFMLGLVFLTVLFTKHNYKPEEALLKGKNLIVSIIVFFFIGIYGGYIQAGVGFLIMAALTGINKLDLIRTNNLKMFVNVVYTAVALIIFAYQIKIEWTAGLWLAAGNMLGAWVSSRWSVNTQSKTLKYITLSVFVILAIALWFY